MCSKYTLQVQRIKRWMTVLTLLHKELWQDCHLQPKVTGQALLYTLSNPPTGPETYFLVGPAGDLKVRAETIKVGLLISVSLERHCDFPA
jgi:hypothetical protein